MSVGILIFPSSTQAAKPEEKPCRKPRLFEFASRDYKKKHNKNIELQISDFLAYALQNQWKRKICWI